MLHYAGARQQSSPQHGKQSIPQARPGLRAKPRKHHVPWPRTSWEYGFQSALYLFYSHKCGSNSACDRRTRVAQQARIAHTRGRGAARDPGQNACTVGGPTPPPSSYREIGMAHDACNQYGVYGCMDLVTTYVSHMYIGIGLLSTTRAAKERSPALAPNFTS